MDTEAVKLANQISKSLEIFHGSKMSPSLVDLIRSMLIAEITAFNLSNEIVPKDPNRGYEL